MPIADGYAKWPNFVPSLTNFVVNSKRKAKMTGGNVAFLFELTSDHEICRRTILFLNVSELCHFNTKGQVHCLGQIRCR
jgi:hypothetical protein